MEAVDTILRKSKEIDMMEKEREIAHKEAILGVRKSLSPGPRSSAYEDHREREMERMRAMRKREVRIYTEKYDASFVSDPTDKVCIPNPPKALKPAPIATIVVGDEKSPETKRGKALDRVIEYAKSLKW